MKTRGTHQTMSRQNDADMSAEAKVGRRIKPQPNGCWLFRGQRDKYGRVNVGGMSIVAHRYVYETLVGPVPANHELHHECVTPGCCNPDHLTPKTRGAHAATHALRDAGPLASRRPTDVLKRVQMERRAAS